MSHGGMGSPAAHPCLPELTFVAVGVPNLMMML